MKESENNGNIGWGQSNKDLERPAEELKPSSLVGKGELKVCSI